MHFRFVPAFAAAALAACTPVTPAIERTSPPATATSLTRASTEVLFWDDATRADRFRHMEDFFPGIEVAPSPHPRALPAGAALPAAASGALDKYLARGDIAGIMVLQGGKVRYEKYGLGFGPDQRWTSFSMAKSLTSTLAGAAMKDGYIKSLDDKVSQYVPGLAGSAYDDVTLEQLLTMTSGVAWNEDYADPNSDVARIFAVEPDPGRIPGSHGDEEAAARGTRRARNGSTRPARPTLSVSWSRRRPDGHWLNMPNRSWSIRPDWRASYSGRPS